MLDKINKEDFKEISAKAVSNALNTVIAVGDSAEKNLDPVLGMALLAFGVDVCKNIEKMLFEDEVKEEKK